MDKYKAFIIALGIFVVFLVALSFSEARSPFSQQEITLDNIRTRNLSDIRFQIENYYYINNQLPATLEDLGVKITTIDPKTQKPYEYKITSPTTYELCAEFATDSRDSVETYAPENIHGKGYECIKFNVTPAVR